MALEERMAKIEGAFEQVAQRLNHLETEMAYLRERLDRNLYWILGIQITMWVTIILAILLRT